MIKRRLVPICAAGALLLTSACFHQIVSTGRTPATTVIEKPWVSGWFWGIVAPSEIDVRRECPTGVAVVTTETSFMNGLAFVLTAGIYSPQHVSITCASGTASLPRNLRELRIPADATIDASAKIVAQALALATETNAPVVIRYEPITAAEER